ncbi:MAG TPA: cysteine desulfurase family protein [Gemmatimonadaceae bacterium]|jgi:cysteine desulfurase|nr:cysteine desulfurase family protein [Gemmatimonadaceae bacterium]
MPEPVYLDHAATTPVREEVFAAMQPFFGPRFGNPSSVHRWGRDARTALDEARERLARCLGASPDEVVFTSCGTEADNMALIGVWRARRGEGRRGAASTPIEHKAVLGALHQIAKEGGDERLVAVDPNGRVDSASFDQQVRDDVAVCSVMWVNNEIGTLQDIGELATRAKSRGVVFHTDAVQAFGKVEVDARKTPFDLLSISGHKIGAPKGIGALYLRRGTPMEALMFGGSQDRGRRPGTENVAMAVGLAVAAELAVAERAEEWSRLARLRDRFEAALLARVPDAIIHARGAPRAPHITNVSVPGTESESMLIALDLRGIACSAGSACQSGSVNPSHVLESIGVGSEVAGAALRMSFGSLNDDASVDRAAEVFATLAEKARRLATA